MRDGLVPMADILNIQQVGDEPIFGVEGIPFISNNIDELKVLHKYVRPEFEKIAAKNNQTILYIGAVADAVSAPQGEGRARSTG